MSVKTLLTAEDFLQMPDLPGKRFELVNGALVEMSGATALHGDVADLIREVLKAFVRLHKLGRVYGDGVGYIVAHDRDVVRIPDVSFVDRTRIPATGVPDTFWPFAPDLAVEVASTNDRPSDLRKKVQENLEAGSRLVWVAWPPARVFDVFTPDGLVRRLGPDDELDGGAVLPGFRVRVGHLFEIEE